MCDLVLYCDQEASGRRVIRTKPKVSYDAGDRSGKLPETIDCTYAALSSAFSPKAPATAGKVA
jgi:hypothetical protein